MKNELFYYARVMFKGMINVLFKDTADAAFFSQNELLNNLRKL